MSRDKTDSMIKLPEWIRNDPRTVRATQVQVGDQVLPLEMRRLRHARRLTLRLAPDGRTVRVSMPHWVSAQEALAFATSRSDWLAAQIDRVPQPSPPAPSGTIAYRGTTLTIAWRPAAGRRPVVVNDTLVIGGPAESLPTRTARWLENEARRLIADDLAHYCAVVGKPAPALALSRARRRWGSCAASGTIRINWRLIMAPDFVRRSVVAHEVAHLVHFDHSPAFHACLHGLFEDRVDTANAWLKRHGATLYLPFG